MRKRFLGSVVASTLVLSCVTMTPAFADDGGSMNNVNQGFSISQWLAQLLQGMSSSGPTQGAMPITLNAGWNLVDQAVASSLSSSTLTDFWNGTAYQTQSPSAGDGSWAYLKAPQTVYLSLPSSPQQTVSLSATSWGMIGNPYTTNVTVSLQPGDMAFTYDPTTAQYSVPASGSLTLKPGQGAWLFSKKGGSYFIGLQPPAPPPTPTVTSSVY